MSNTKVQRALGATVFALAPAPRKRASPPITAKALAVNGSIAKEIIPVLGSGMLRPYLEMDSRYSMFVPW